MVVFADWVVAYNTRRAHTALAGRTPLEVWRSDPTPVRALDHEQARWMLLARKAHVVQRDGIHHDCAIFFADELSGMAGEEVGVAYMPHDRRWVEVFHGGKWLATARPLVELDAAARGRVLERRREDAKELRAWARRARRACDGAGRADHRTGRDRAARPTRAAVAASGRSWTIVRPGRLTDDPVPDLAATAFTDPSIHTNPRIPLLRETIELLQARLRRLTPGSPARSPGSSGSSEAAVALDRDEEAVPRAPG